MRKFRSGYLTAVTLGVVLASVRSSPAQTLRFDVASVKLSPAGSNSLEHRQLRVVDHGRVRYVNVGLKALILDAYNIRAYQVAGPEWLSGMSVDIDATMPAGTTKEEMRMMFRNLLADRFKLTSHWSTRDLPVYSIAVVGNGPRMREAVEVPLAGNDAIPQPAEGPVRLDADGFPLSPGPERDGVGTIMINGRSRLHGQRATMQDLANELSKTQLEYPVTDETGLKSKYDFTLKFATPGWNGRLEDIPELGISAIVYEAMEPLPDLAAALQSQLGLKLISTKAPVEVFVVDHVEKAPTEN